MRKPPFKWKCPYCRTHSVITKKLHRINFHRICTYSSKYENIGIASEVIECPNDECNEIVVNVFMVGMVEDEMGRRCIDVNNIFGEWNILPGSKAMRLPSYVPEAIRKDYEEACRILNDSPKASATLARRCLQGIVRDFWDIPKNKRGNLSAELNHLRESIDDATWDIIEAIRKIGNIGAHMEEDVNVIIEVEREEAEFLIELIESLIDAWYVARHDAEERRKRAVELVKRKKEQKQQAKAKAGNAAEGSQ